MSKETTIFDLLLQQRDEEREARKTAKVVLKGKDLPLENNRMGHYRWYLHPYRKDAPHRGLQLWVEEIPPGSKSGKQLIQGGRIHHVWEGRGYTEVDGVRHDWKEGDIILLPIKGHGVTYQHFNLDPQKPALLISAEPNLAQAYGIDKGSGFEVLENSPDYKP
jgi:gentisate 1,2-dioxygenase